MMKEETNNDYYTKARTDKGWLFFKTKADFEKWKSEDEDKAGGTNAGGLI